MKYNNIEVEVLIKGKSITEYPHNGQVFVEGRDGSEFEVAVYNRNPHRVEAVISVDGLSVIDGKDAGPNSSGYVIDAHGSVRIPGWKLDDKQVAAFTFAGKAASYSAHMNQGDARNTGVIGVLAFQEKPRYRQPIYASGYGAAFPKGGQPRGIMRSAATRGRGLESLGMNSVTTSSLMGGAPSASVGEVDSSFSAGAIEQSLGTGFGESQDFATSTTTFERADLQAMIIMYYDDSRGLKARGIDLSRRSRRTSAPNAFPGMGCAPPPGWRG